MSSSDPLELTSLDTESLLRALLNAEKAIPSLLQDVKPVLTHLRESDPSEDVSSAAKEAVDRYMNTLDVNARPHRLKDVAIHLYTQLVDIGARSAYDSSGTVENALALTLTTQKIQFILRQTVYFLRETKSAPNAMRPPPVDGIPRPFAALRGEEVGLGLYGLRVERDTLKLLQGSVEGMCEQKLRLGEDKKADDDGDGDRGANEGEAMDM